MLANRPYKQETRLANMNQLVFDGTLDPWNLDRIDIFRLHQNYMRKNRLKLPIEYSSKNSSILFPFNLPYRSFSVENKRYVSFPKQSMLLKKKKSFQFHLNFRKQKTPHTNQFTIFTSILFRRRTTIN